MLLGVSGSGLVLSDTTGVSLALWHRPTHESHPEWWQRMLTKPQNTLGLWNHRNGHMWDIFTSLGLIWTDLNHKFLIQICLEPGYGSGQVFCFVCLSRIWFWMLSRKKKINVYDVHFRSPFGSWMRRECHHKGGIAEARLKLCSKAAAVLCIADVIESPPWSVSLFPGVTLSSVSSVLRAECGPAYECKGVKNATAEVGLFQRAVT